MDNEGGRVKEQEEGMMEVARWMEESGLESESEPRLYPYPRRRTSMCTNPFPWNNAFTMTSSFSVWLCTRRIHSFLQDYLLDGTAHQLEQESTSFFDMAYLEYLVKTARFEEADRYVLWFMPPWAERSAEAEKFHRIFNSYRNLVSISRGGHYADFVIAGYPLLDDAAAKANPLKAKRNAFLHQFHRYRPKDPNYLLKLWESAAKRLRALLTECPELNRKLHRPPEYAPKSWQINLAGVRPVPRPYKKKRLTQAQVLAACNFFVQKRHKINTNLKARQQKEDTHMNTPGPSSAPVFAPVLSNSAALDATVAPAMLGEGANGDVNKSLLQKMSVLMDTKAD